jgi:hypothetical protein
VSVRVLTIIVTNDINHHGSKFSEGSVTLLVNQLSESGDTETTIIRDYDPNPVGKVLAQEISYQYNKKMNTLTLTATGKHYTY